MLLVFKTNRSFKVQNISRHSFAPYHNFDYITVNIINYLYIKPRSIFQSEVDIDIAIIQIPKYKLYTAININPHTIFSRSEILSQTIPVIRSLDLANPVFIDDSRQRQTNPCYAINWNGICQPLSILIMYQWQCEIDRKLLANWLINTCGINSFHNILEYMSCFFW